MLRWMKRAIEAREHRDRIAGVIEAHGAISYKRLLLTAMPWYSKGKIDQLVKELVDLGWVDYDAGTQTLAHVPTAQRPRPLARAFGRSTGRPAQRGPAEASPGSASELLPDHPFVQ